MMMRRLAVEPQNIVVVASEIWPSLSDKRRRATSLALPGAESEMMRTGAVG